MSAKMTRYWCPVVRTVTVTTCGRICWKCQQINLSQVLAAQTGRGKQAERWLVTLMHYEYSCPKKHPPEHCGRDQCWRECYLLISFQSRSSALRRGCNVPGDRTV